MENTIIRRAAQLIQDLRMLSILKNDDVIRSLIIRGLEGICLEITFADEEVTEEHGRYQLVILAFEKEFGKKNIETIIPPKADSQRNELKIDIML